MQFIKTSFFCLIIICLETSCTNEEKKVAVPTPNYFDYGQVKESIYQNKFFGLSIKIPNSWKVLSDQQRANNLGRKGGATDGKILPEQITSANLLTMFKDKLASTEVYNSNLILVADNLAKLPHVKSSEDYLQHTQNVLKQAKVTFKVMNELLAKEEINGEQFQTMHVILENKGVEIHQNYYAITKNGFNLCAVISYVDDENKAQLMEIVGSMKFD